MSRSLNATVPQGLVAAQNAGNETAVHRLRAAVDQIAHRTGVAECWWLLYQGLDAMLSGRPEKARPIPAATLDRALSVGDDFDRLVWIQMSSTVCVMVGDIAMASKIWDHHVDIAARDVTPAGECIGRFHHGKFLAAVNEPGARAEFERAADLAHQFDWPMIEHVALSELAATLATEGEIAIARPRLATAIRTWIQVGDLGQLWTTLHHVVDALATEGDPQRAGEVWVQLRDRLGFASQMQRSALQNQFGEPPAATLTDEEILVWSRDLADHLATS